MTVDRIRQAADTLATWATDTSRDTTSTQDTWAAQVDAATADLLRAVADTHAHYPNCSCVEYVTASRLADHLLTTVE